MSSVYVYQDDIYAYLCECLVSTIYCMRALQIIYTLYTGNYRVHRIPGTQNQAQIGRFRFLEYRTRPKQVGLGSQNTEPGLDRQVQVPNIQNQVQIGRFRFLEYRTRPRQVVLGSQNTEPGLDRQFQVPGIQYQAQIWV